MTQAHCAPQQTLLQSKAQCPALLLHPAISATEGSAATYAFAARAVIFAGPSRTRESLGLQLAHEAQTKRGGAPLPFQTDTPLLHCSSVCPACPFPHTPALLAPLHASVCACVHTSKHESTHLHTARPRTHPHAPVCVHVRATPLSQFQAACGAAADATATSQTQSASGSNSSSTTTSTTLGPSASLLPCSAPTSGPGQVAVQVRARLGCARLAHSPMCLCMCMCECMHASDASQCNALFLCVYAFSACANGTASLA